MSEVKNMEKTLVSLKKRADFLHVQKNGQKWVSKSFILQIYENNEKGQRFGLIVTKKLFKLAVDRNRVKRRLREAIGDILTQSALNHHDYVFIARHDTISMPFEDLKKDMLWCLKRLEAIETKEKSAII